MDIGLPEIAIIFFVVLLLFGPGRLKSLGGEMGEGIRRFKEGLQGPENEPASAENEQSE